LLGDVTKISAFLALDICKNCYIVQPRSELSRRGFCKSDPTDDREQTNGYLPLITSSPKSTNIESVVLESAELKARSGTLRCKQANATGNPAAFKNRRYQNPPDPSLRRTVLFAYPSTAVCCEFLLDSANSLIK